MNKNMKQAFQAFKKAEEAVSPVVATLLLVLVASGAAVGFSVFLGSFQEDAQENLNGDIANAQTLTIAGSSTVYEFSQVALAGDPEAGLPAFEDWAALQGTPIKVQLEKGGSGSGRIAVAKCLIDIGSSSSNFKDSELDVWPDCNGDGVKDFGQSMHIQKVATDGVVFATLASNTHCDAPVELTMADALEIYAKNGEAQGATVAPGSAAEAAAAAVGITAANTPVTWADITLLNGGAAVCTGPEQIEVFDRQDPGGTSEIASEKLFGQKQNQLEDFGLTLTADHQGDGNQGVLDTVEDHANADHAMFFTSFGYANAQGLDVYAFGKDLASILQPSSSNIKDESYDATRPILYATAGEPSALEQIWLDFVTNSHYNQLIANGADFEHIY